jgi:hypothetical protein
MLSVNLRPKPSGSERILSRSSVEVRTVVGWISIAKDDGIEAA